MIPREDAIRDEIANRPELIEVGMRTIRPNYPLPNSQGTRGFIDILARDRHGLVAVIEVKRSDSTAREAIHEVLKYCELLRVERGLRADQVRAIIASTSWSELMVPFSEIARVSEYPIEGVLLDLGDNFPASLTSRRVEPLDVPPDRDLSALAIRLDLRDPSEAQGRWDDLVARLAAEGITDALGIVAGNSSRTILHLALGMVGDGRSDEDRPPATSSTEDLDDEDEVLVEAPEGQEREYAAAMQVIEALDEHADLTGPERLYRIMVSNRLDVLRVLRAGRFAEQADLIDDNEAVGLAEGRAGWNQIMVDLTGRPSHGLAWRRLRTRLDYCLFSNLRWKRLLGLWLDEVERNRAMADVVLHVYNPCDLMAGLVHSGLGGDLNRLLPRIEGGLDLPGDEGRLLDGVLAWNGRPVATAVEDIRTVYSWPGDWGIARASGGVWETDVALLEALGLDYQLFEFAPGDRPPVRLEERDGVLIRESAGSGQTWPDCRPLPEWLRAVDLADLLDEYRSTMVPTNGGDQWWVIDGPRGASKA